MDRETRKANLKKLQLPGTGTKTQAQPRKIRQTTKSTVASTISNYFSTPEQQASVPKTTDTSKDAVQINVNESKKEAAKPKTTRSKRTKLDAFVFKEPQDLKTAPNCINDDDDDDDDLIIPEKKVKRAPSTVKERPKPTKTSKRKKQTTIKSAFLRNEQLFSEIAAQHCAADNFDGDDVQLAIAISQSEVESNGLFINDDNATNGDKDEAVHLGDADKNAELIRQKLEKYGFRTAEKQDYNAFAAAFLPKPKSRQKKSKWANKFTALTLRDEQLQNKKLQLKIDHLISQQMSAKAPNTNDQLLTNYLLQSSLLKKIVVENEQKICRQKNDLQTEQYFVGELFPIATLSPGHLLKDWKAIQGRDLTPTKRSRCREELKIKLQNIYAELEDYFNTLTTSKTMLENETICNDEKILQKSNENPKINSLNMDDKGNLEQPDLKAQDSVTAENNACKKTELSHSNSIDVKTPTKRKNYFVPLENEEYNSSSEMKALLPSKIRLDLMQVSYNSIETDAATCNSTPNLPTKIGLNNTEPNDSTVSKTLSSTANLDKMQVSSLSLGTETNNNSAQKTRCNSPDLFADSDVEMEDVDDMNEKAASDVSVNKSSNSMKNATGLTTYEIYSSDEVKNISSLELPDSSQNKSTFDKTSTHNNITTERVQNLCNHSKPIIEEDLFAESPTHEEAEAMIDINSNSQKSLYLKNTDETFKFTLSLQAESKSPSPKKTKLNSSKFSLESNKYDDGDNDDDDDDVIFCDIAKNQTNSSFLNFQGFGQLQTSFHRKTAKELEAVQIIAKDKTATLDISMEPEQIRECHYNATDSINNQTNNTFLNYHKSEQLKTSNLMQDNTCQRSIAGNETIFKNLYQKYLGSSGATTISEKSYKTNNLGLRKSLSQILPTTDSNATKFTMDLEMTVKHSSNRKSFHSSFNENISDKNISHLNVGLSKSQSFTGQNISIDLTQTEDDDYKTANDEDLEEDDDCLVLSDDEINYSIWQANKTAHSKDFKDNLDTEDAISIEGDVFLSQVVSPAKHISTTQNSYSDFEVQSPKSNDKQHELERSNFGILEEFSQNVDFLPDLSTPNKLLAEASFLQSPTELTVPMKRYSSCQKSKQKFNDLIQSVDNATFPPHNDLDEYDEFDCLVYQNQVKTTKSATQLPQNFDSLMTGAISLDKSQKVNVLTNHTPNIDMHNSYLEHDSTSAIIRKYKTCPEVTKSKTPTISHNDEPQVLTINNKTYTIRNVEDAKPNYALYSEAELLKLLYNYGIKPLKRNQAVKMLEYIYLQTHPIIVEEAIKVYDDTKKIELPTTSKMSIKSNTNIPTASQKVASQKSSSNSSLQMATMENVYSINTLNLQDGLGDDMLRYTSDLQAELLEEQYILQTNVTKKTPQPLMPFHIAWFNLVCANRNLHENILMYEPIDLQEIYLFLKGLGYRYDPKDLKQFFDRRCIIFRYDLAGNKIKDNNRHVRKPKQVKRK